MKKLLLLIYFNINIIKRRTQHAFYKERQQNVYILLHIVNIINIEWMNEWMMHLYFLNI